jgi:hypothetical protein
MQKYDFTHVKNDDFSKSAFYRPFTSGSSTEVGDRSKNSKARAMNCADFCIRHAREGEHLRLTACRQRLRLKNRSASSPALFVSHSFPASAGMTS